MAQVQGAIGKNLTKTEAIAITCLATAGLYNVLEIYVLIFTTFRRRSGRYFWSMLMANTGILFHACGSLGRFLQPTRSPIPGAFAHVGWYCMVTGQSVVLWSRLHLVVYSRITIRLVLAMIVSTVLLVHIPQTVLFAGVWASNDPVWTDRFRLFEKVSLLVFTLQETTITGIFVRAGFQNLKSLFEFKAREARSLLGSLVAMFALVFLLDVSLVILEYMGMFVFQISSKPIVYSVKLKVEFAVLQKLLAFTKMKSCDCHRLGDITGPRNKTTTNDTTLVDTMT
ncbi:putative integral membrane protein [Colletotrichum sublineola]|uniref:Putative integral membrane protein n=1 Tax=Colletotrichum sublineola TaxID=1173701 RepID=A0A066WV22_COLSU|nr:putative integral membrane protein [Colletotrichum sublineola]